MSFLVVMIVDDPENYIPILEAWDSIGVSGVTILQSTGLGRLRRTMYMDDLPLLPRLQDFEESLEVQHRTLLSVVDDDETVTKMVKAAQEITGDLDIPNSGFLFVLPVIKAFGLNRRDE
jgi:nitrogen regulatory protein P-II 1